MSWKPYFEVQGEWATNGQAFATKEEAFASARNRFAVWTTPTDFGVRESFEDVNYRHNFETGQDEMVNREPVCPTGLG